MDPKLSQEHLPARVLVSLFLVVLACGSGYWIARFLPVRFNGEKALIGLSTGSLLALAIYGLDKMMNDQVPISQIIWTIGWFFLQGLAGEATVQATARRRKTKP